MAGRERRPRSSSFSPGVGRRRALDVIPAGSTFSGGYGVAPAAPAAAGASSVLDIGDVDEVS